MNMRARGVLFWAGVLLATSLAAVAGPNDPEAQKPADTVSPAWQQFWPKLVASLKAMSPDDPAPDDVAAWTRQQARAEAELGDKTVRAVRRYFDVRVQVLKLDGVTVLQVDPSSLKADDPRVLIYLHGGGYTSQSARSSLGNAAWVARLTGLRVLSVDYTLAPTARWTQMGPQVVTAYRAILKDRPASAIGLWGESAGGGLAASVVLRLRDAGLPLPGGLVLWSPWVDLSLAGDSVTTLAAADPMMIVRKIRASAAAYASPADQRQPYASPLYGDFSKGYVPTLVQCGTREVLLSQCVRFYQRLSAADVPVTLDLYEGMPHVFQMLLPDAPEAQQALQVVRRFWSQHLQAR